MGKPVQVGASENNREYFLKLKLDTIRNFLKHADSDASTEIKSLCEREDAGEFEGKGIDDFGNELYYPLARQEIAARAVYYELNALMESALQASAYRPWLASHKHSGPKTLDLTCVTVDSVRSLKLIQDLPLREIKGLIKKEYGVKIEELEEGDSFQNVREIINAFKHRDGQIDFRKQKLKDSIPLEHHKVDVKQAYEAIDKSYVFIKALWKATNLTESPRS